MQVERADVTAASDARQKARTISIVFLVRPSNESPVAECANIKETFTISLL